MVDDDDDDDPCFFSLVGSLQSQLVYIFRASDERVFSVIVLFGGGDSSSGGSIWVNVFFLPRLWMVVVVDDDGSVDSVMLTTDVFLSFSSAFVFFFLAISKASSWL